MKKQLLLLVMMLLPIVASADDSGKCGDNVTYSYKESTHTLTISGTGAMTNYTWDKNAPWYSYGSEIVKAIIEEGLTSIGNFAFNECSSLTSITIPDGVTNIGDYTFKRCSSLTSIMMPNSVTGIGGGAFISCSSLTFITIPNNVTSIGGAVFAGCSGLTSVTIPNSVTSIGSYAFEGCSSLTSVTIPVSVNSIEDYTFTDCKNLTSVTIPNSVTSIGACAFNGCSSLTSVTIPDGVTSIGSGAFFGCSSLTSVTISNGVTSIGFGAFAHCSSLTSIIIPDGVTNIDGVFANCSSLASITIPSSLTSIGKSAFENCSSLTSIAIPSSVTSIGERTFYGCSGLISITIPSSMTSIGKSTFENCSGLTSITIPNSVTSIGERSFYNCYNIKSIKLPENLQIIKRSTFQNCRSLSIITIPALVEFIYQEAFANCDALESVKAKPGTPPFLYDNSFSNFSVPLEVPKGCKEEYQTAQGWKNFTNISESDKGYYKLIYLVDNEEYKSYKIEEGSSITPEPTPVKEGYTFSGWGEIPETMPAHDVTVTGTFSINKYKLTYVVDGQTYKEYEVEFGATITPEAEPTKEGYTFSGWSEIPETMPAHDVTVTGSFTKGAYKLIYVIDGETYKTISYDYGASITPEPAPTREGYTFSGWSGVPATMPAHDVTVTGSFTINKYKLTYKVDGEVYKTYEIEYGASITPEDEPTKEGYTFSGWSWIPTKMPAEDVIVTGSFTVNQYTITYMIDNEVYMTDKVDYGSTITPPSAPAREGYDFAWGDYPETMPAHDITIYGTYTTGINAILAGKNSNAKVFTIDGKQLEKPQKGINIIRMSDGTVKKIVVAWQ